MSAPSSCPSASSTTNYMQKLPVELIGNIASHLDDSSDLAAFRLVSRHVTAEVTLAFMHVRFEEMSVQATTQHIRVLTRIVTERLPFQNANKAVRRLRVVSHRDQAMYPTAGPSERGVAALLDALPKLDALYIDQGDSAVPSLLQAFTNLNSSTLTVLSMTFNDFSQPIPGELLLNVLQTHTKTLRNITLVSVLIRGLTWAKVFTYMLQDMDLENVSVLELCDSTVQDTEGSCLQFVASPGGFAPWESLGVDGDGEESPATHPSWAYFDWYGFEFHGRGVQSGLEVVIYGQPMSLEDWL